MSKKKSNKEYDFICEGCGKPSLHEVCDTCDDNFWDMVYSGGDF